MFKLLVSVRLNLLLHTTPTQTRCATLLYNYYVITEILEVSNVFNWCYNTKHGHRMSDIDYSPGSTALSDGAVVDNYPII